MDRRSLTTAVVALLVAIVGALAVRKRSGEEPPAPPGSWDPV